MADKFDLGDFITQVIDDVILYGDNIARINAKSRLRTAITAAADRADLRGLDVCSRLRGGSEDE